MPIWLWITLLAVLFLTTGVVGVLNRKRGRSLGGDPASGRRERLSQVDPHTTNHSPDQHGPPL
ncbi:hypothetical protein [Amycolatopsis anabasis]|uniref:hypothetical protein n=1 Tax=Amycolatopsis anabasis TaxID=1840409 RepID=UPI00131DBFD5|nr:hypothetical protein [Amycolatopsis anabasis]